MLHVEGHKNVCIGLDGMRFLIVSLRSSCGRPYDVSTSCCDATPPYRDSLWRCDDHSVTLGVTVRDWSGCRSLGEHHSFVHSFIHSFIFCIHYLIGVGINSLLAWQDDGLIRFHSVYVERIEVLPIPGWFSLSGSTGHKKHLSTLGQVLKTRIGRARLSLCPRSWSPNGESSEKGIRGRAIYGSRSFGVDENIHQLHTALRFPRDLLGKIFW